MKLFDENCLSYGKIICKCNLVDCIYMTEKFIEEEKKKDYNNFIAGHYKVGRYAWVLKDVVRYDTPKKYTKKPGAIVWVNVETF